MAVVTVMSVQPTSEKRTVLHDSGSPAWLGSGKPSNGKLSAAVRISDVQAFMGQTPTGCRRQRVTGKCRLAFEVLYCFCAGAAEEAPVFFQTAACSIPNQRKAAGAVLR
jgi:hypothetical protein